MKPFITGSALFAVLSLGTIAAHASCPDSRGGVPQISQLVMHPGPMISHFELSARENIVGTWHVAYTSFGAPFADAFIQWHADGTEWENINLPVLDGNICMGSWRSVDATHVLRNHFGWVYANGIASGYFEETETDEVSQDGNSYTGVNETTIYDLSGNVQVKIPGTSTATKIAP